MAEDTDNLTIKMLQEMRTEMREFRTEVNNRFDAVDAYMDQSANADMVLSQHVYESLEKLEAK